MKNTKILMGFPEEIIISDKKCCYIGSMISVKTSDDSDFDNIHVMIYDKIGVVDYIFLPINFRLHSFLISKCLYHIVVLPPKSRKDEFLKRCNGDVIFNLIKSSFEDIIESFNNDKQHGYSKVYYMLPNINEMIKLI